jgi:hypothetical protein
MERFIVSLSSGAFVPAFAVDGADYARRPLALG